MRSLRLLWVGLVVLVVACQSGTPPPALTPTVGSTMTEESVPTSSAERSACQGGERPPSCAVVAFYERLADGDAATAHTLLAPDLQADVPPDELAERFGQTLVELNMAEDAETETRRVHVRVESQGARWDGTWLLQRQEEQWLLIDFQPGSAMPELSSEGELRQLLGEEGYPLAVPPGEEMFHWRTADLDGAGEDELAVHTCICDEAAYPGGGYLRILKAGGDGWERDLSDPIIEGFELVAEIPVDSSCCVFQSNFRVTQVRADGGLGLVEQSFCGAHATCLSLYTWDGTAYRAFYFSSSAMSITVNPDGTVVVGQRDYLRINDYDTGWTGVYRWDGSDYVLESVTFTGPTYVDEETGEPRPTGAIYAYYNAIRICLHEGDFYAAYAYLSEDFQARQPYDDFAAGFANTVDVDVEEVTLIEERADEASVEAVVIAADEIDGDQRETRYTITWQLTKEGGAWALDQADVQPE